MLPIFRPLRLLLPVAAALLAGAACNHERKVDIASGLDPNKMPTMLTTDVATFISDSGIIQYKIVSPEWRVYENADTPYWIFPKGLYMQKFDRNYKTIASVACDSAIYFKSLKLWRLDGNVEMHRAPADVFLTQQLFWNEREHRLYSDSFIHIDTPTQILEGYGFESDERVTRYTVRRPQGAFPVNESSMPTPGPGPVPQSPTPTAGVDTVTL